MNSAQLIHFNHSSPRTCRFFKTSEDKRDNIDVGKNQQMNCVELSDDIQSNGRSRVLGPRPLYNVLAAEYVGIDQWWVRNFSLTPSDGNKYYIYFFYFAVSAKMDDMLIANSCLAG